MKLHIYRNLKRTDPNFRRFEYRRADNLRVLWFGPITIILYP